jgi:hypothetical protein
MSASIVILQIAVLAVVLESDLGHRKIGWFRVLRPVITVILIVPFFFTSLPASGADLLLQGAGALAGLVLGLFCVSPLLVRVGFDPAYQGRRARLAAWFRPVGGPPADRPATVSQAGLGYALTWIVVSAARLGFAWGSEHVFSAALGQFLASDQLSPAALANAFIFLAVGMDLFRSAGLVVRGRSARRRSGPGREPRGNVAGWEFTGPAA